MFYAISPIFKAPFLERIARGTHCSLFKELREHFPTPLEDKPLKDWFDFFYDILLEKYRCEYVYKNILTTQLFLEGKHFPQDCWLINEWRVNKSRADIVIMNGESTTYEIKSKFDSLDRLESQIADYQKVFDKIYIVTTEEKVKSVLNKVGKAIGIYELKKDKLEEIQEPESNKANTDPATIFDCLHQGEYLSIIEEKFGDTPDVPSGILFAESKKLFCQLEPTEAHDSMVERIRKRGKRKPYMDLVENAPDSLKHACFSFSKTQAMAKKIKKRLKEPLRI